MSKGVILYVGNFELPDHGASANRVVSNAKLFNQLGYQTALLGVTRDASCREERTKNCIIPKASTDTFWRCRERISEWAYIPRH